MYYNYSNSQVEAFKREIQNQKAEIKRLIHNEIEAEDLREENMAKKLEIEQLEADMKKAHTDCKEWEDKYNSLQSELAGFTECESVTKIKQIEEYLQTIKRNLNSTIEEMTSCSKELNRKECSDAIEQQIAQYRELMGELSNAGIAFMSEPNFPLMIKDYDQICKVNDANIKNIFKPLYEASKRLENKINEFTLNIDNSLKDVERFMEAENYKLRMLDKKSVQDSMSIEKELHADVLDTIAERISILDSVKEVVDSKSGKVKSRTARKDYQHLIENFTNSGNSAENSIMMYEVLENDDLSKVKDIQVERLDDPGRPVKVTFPDPEIIERLLLFSKEMTLLDH